MTKARPIQPHDVVGVLPAPAEEHLPALEGADLLALERHGIGVAPASSAKASSRLVTQGWLETESTKTGCTLSQERRIKHACLMLQPPLLQLSVVLNLLAEQEVVLDQDGRLLLPSPTLCRPGCGKRLCGGCTRVSWKLQHIFRSFELSIT